MAMNAKHNHEDGQSSEMISPQAIAARAYEIYEREGRAEGRDFDHWLRAESELRAERANSQANSAKASASQSARANESSARESEGAGRGKSPKRANRPIAAAARN